MYCPAANRHSFSQEGRPFLRCLWTPGLGEGGRFQGESQMKTAGPGPAEGAKISSPAGGCISQLPGTFLAPLPRLGLCGTLGFPHSLQSLRAG